MPASIPSTWVRHCCRPTHTMNRAVLRVSGRPGSGNGIVCIRVPTVCRGGDAPTPVFRAAR